MLSRTTMLAALMAVVAVFAAADTAAAASRYQVLDRMENFRQYFLDFQQAPDGAIPGDLLAECYGIIILRQYKAGFIVGVKGGDGMIMMHDRNTGEWSPPAFVVSAEGSFGLQIGGQAIDGIFLIMNQSGVDMLLRTRFKIGVDASAAAGPVGRDVAAQVGPGTALLTYSRSKGLYAGASFEGGALLNYDKYNRALYGRDVSLREILLDRTVPMPQEALNMVRTLKMYAIRGSVNSAPTAYGGSSQQAGQWYEQAPAQPGYGQEFGQPSAGSYGDPYGQPYQQPVQHYPSPDSPQPYQDPYYQQPNQDPYYQQPQYPAQPQPRITGAEYEGYPGSGTIAPTYGTAPIIPPAPEPLPYYGAYQPPPNPNQAALDAAAGQAARDAQLAAEAARNAAMAAEAAAARAAAARSGGY